MNYYQKIYEGVQRVMSTNKDLRKFGNMSYQEFLNRAQKKGKLAWHGTTQSFKPQEIEPRSGAIHLGTKDAAKQRLRYNIPGEPAAGVEFPIRRNTEFKRDYKGNKVAARLLPYTIKKGNITSKQSDTDTNAALEYTNSLKDLKNARSMATQYHRTSGFRNELAKRLKLFKNIRGGGNIIPYKNEFEHTGSTSYAVQDPKLLLHHRQLVKKYADPNRRRMKAAALKALLNQRRTAWGKLQAQQGIDRMMGRSG